MTATTLKQLEDMLKGFLKMNIDGHLKASNGFKYEVHSAG